MKRLIAFVGWESEKQHALKELNEILIDQVIVISFSAVDGLSEDAVIRTKIWADRVKMQFAINPQSVVVCLDARFDYQFTAIRELGGLVIQTLPTAGPIGGKLPCNYIDRWVPMNDFRYHLVKSVMMEYRP